MADAGIFSGNERVELLNGEIICMSPINSPHAACVDCLTEWFILYFHKKAIIRVQNPIRLDVYSEPEPDLVVAGLKPDKYKSGHPVPNEVMLVIEVADSSLDKDRSVKLPKYSYVGIAEAWLINLERQEVEVHTQPAETGYSKLKVFRIGQVIETSLVAGLPVEDIF